MHSYIKIFCGNDLVFAAHEKEFDKLCAVFLDPPVSGFIAIESPAGEKNPLFIRPSAIWAFFLTTCEDRKAFSEWDAGNEEDVEEEREPWMN